MTETKPQAAPADQGPSVPPPPPDQADLSIKDLARAVLARQFRPRVASVRRLAEAVLAKGQKKPKKKAKPGENGEKKVRKLAKIPGQKGR